MTNDEIAQLIRHLTVEVRQLRADIAKRDGRQVPIGQAAKMLGISTGALRKRAARGTVPYSYSNTGRLMFSVSDLITNNKI